MDALQALALSKKYTAETMQGAGALKGEKGDPGKDGFTPTVKENPSNTEDYYRLDIENSDKKFTTPNLMGVIGMEYKNESAGTPVGEIISYMGTIAPENYLICDGAAYQIADYPILAKHFEDNFGSKNYFGGDGTETFAVPDLRGEFIRGAGLNGREGQGSGEMVGGHQDATLLYRDLINPNSALFARYWTNETSYLQPQNADSTNAYAINPSDVQAAKLMMTKYVPSTTTNTRYTLRPTNTSVLYCIKYKPTYFVVTSNTGEG